MEEGSGVEVVIRKKPPLSVSFGNVAKPPVPPVDAMPAATSVVPTSIRKPIIRKPTGNQLKFLLMIVIILAIGFGVYKGYPMVTSFVLAGFGTDFDYTITAMAVETYSDTGTDEISFMEESGSKIVDLESSTTVEIYLYNGEDLNFITDFGALEGDSVRLTFDYFAGAGGSAKVSKNGVKIFSDLRTDIKGVQLQYESTKEYEEERTAVQEGSAKVSKNGKSRQIVEVEIAPETVEAGGELGEITYEITTPDENVEAWVEDGFLYAKYVMPEEPAADGETAEGEE